MNETRARRLLNSYKQWPGKELIPVDSKLPLLEQLEESAVVILSPGTEPDPVLKYGNANALSLWEMSKEQFTKTPSRLTAEPMEREQRAEFFRNVTSNGYADNYTGIRISATGRRFYIKAATVWNVLDEQGQYCGQAAAFRTIERIES